MNTKSMIETLKKSALLLASVCYLYICIAIPFRVLISGQTMTFLALELRQNRIVLSRNNKIIKKTTNNVEYYLSIVN